MWTKAEERLEVKQFQSNVTLSVRALLRRTSKNVQMICSRVQAEFLALASGRDGVSYLKGQNDRTRPLTAALMLTAQRNAQQAEGSRGQR